MHSGLDWMAGIPTLVAADLISMTVLIYQQESAGVECDRQLNFEYNVEETEGGHLWPVTT